MKSLKVANFLYDLEIIYYSLDAHSQIYHLTERYKQNEEVEIIENTQHHYQHIPT